MSDFPKMVYPGGNSVSHDGAGSVGQPEFAGVVVEDEHQEKWVMDGNKLEDFGKPVEEKAEAKPQGWSK